MFASSNEDLLSKWTVLGISWVWGWKMDFLEKVFKCNKNFTRSFLWFQKLCLRVWIENIVFSATSLSSKWESFFWTQILFSLYEKGRKFTDITTPNSLLSLWLEVKYTVSFFDACSHGKDHDTQSIQYFLHNISWGEKGLGYIVHICLMFW